MRLALCNLLGPICTTYRSNDGSVIRRTTRESLAIEHDNESINVQFYYKGDGTFEYYFPEEIPIRKREELRRMLDTYCLKKWYRLAK
jgi:hypothetical protein